MQCETDQQIRALLLRDERFLQLTVRKGGVADELVGKRLRDPQFPAGALVALIHRSNDSFVPTSDDVIANGDRLTIIGNPGAIEALRARFESSDSLSNDS